MVMVTKTIPLNHGRGQCRVLMLTLRLTAPSTPARRRLWLHLQRSVVQLAPSPPIATYCHIYGGFAAEALGQTLRLTSGRRVRCIGLF